MFGFGKKKDEEIDDGYDLYLGPNIDGSSIQKVYFIQRGSMLDHMAIKFLNGKIENPTLFWNGLKVAFSETKDVLSPGNWQVRELTVSGKKFRVVMKTEKAKQNDL